MRKQNSNFEARFISEEGSQLKNKDYFGYVELDEFACYVIADGITESADADGAKLAIETVVLSFQEHPSISKRAVKRALKQANRALFGKESDKRLKASITVVVTDYRNMRYGYAGNTRLRMYRGGTVYRQTRDLSLAQEMITQDKISKDELMRHEERNNLYTYLGQKNFEPVISKKIKLAETDMIALYTRGLWENVDEAELDDVFADADNEVQTTVDNIEELLLSRQPENLDNYTLAVIFVNKIYKNPERRRKIKKIVCITILVVLVLTIICIAVWFWHRKKVQRMEDMNYHFTNTVEYVNTGNYVRAKDECEQAQELAEKLKDHRMRSRLQEYLFLIEMVLLADETYSSKEYETAQEHYLSALDRSRYADNIGKDYIEDKLGRIHAYLSVEDYLALGDALFAQGDYAAAEEKYLLAKKAALDVHDAEGKQNAMDALENLYEKQAEEESKAQEEADQQAKQEVAAAEMIAAGDQACMEQDYAGAKVYYTMAAAKYKELSDEEGTQAAQGKLDAVAQKMDEQEKQKDTAAAYESQGEACRQSGDLWGAKSQYLSAKSIYQEIGSDEDVQRVTEIIGGIDAQMGLTDG
ncbi:MAG: hypothetical protein HFI84_04595 [Eubacterium sp.]|nr:hypothetical protein [Eubacterium sp.]